MYFADAVDMARPESWNSSIFDLIGHYLTLGFLRQFGCDALPVSRRGAKGHEHSEAYNIDHRQKLERLKP